MNFAVRILREICPAQELVGKNIRGARGKQAVDPSKVEQIRELIKNITLLLQVKLKETGESAEKQWIHF